MATQQQQKKTAHWQLTTVFKLIGIQMTDFQMTFKIRTIQILNMFGIQMINVYKPSE